MNNGIYHTDHFLERMDEREITEITIEYALKYGSRRAGRKVGTYLYILTKEKIHDLIFGEDLTRDDKIALTMVEHRGGLIVIQSKKGVLITTYYKRGKIQKPRKSKQSKPRTGNYPILGCIKELESNQSIKVTGLSRRKINQAYQCLKYRYKEVN